MKKNNKKAKRRQSRYSRKRKKKEQVRKVLLLSGVLVILLMVNGFVSMVSRPVHATNNKVVLENNSDWQMLATIGYKKDSSKLKLLYKYLTHEEESLRVEAAKSLGKIKRWEALPYLIESLSDSSSWVRSYVNRSIAKIMGINYQLHLGNELERSRNQRWIRKIYKEQKVNYDDYKQRNLVIVKEED